MGVQVVGLGIDDRGSRVFPYVLPEEARAMARAISATMRDAAYSASADIAAVANCTCSVYLWSPDYGDVRTFIGDRTRGPITRELDSYNPGNYVVPDAPVVTGGAR